MFKFTPCGFATADPWRNLQVGYEFHKFTDDTNDLRPLVFLIRIYSAGAVGLFSAAATYH